MTFLLFIDSFSTNNTISNTFGVFVVVIIGIATILWNDLLYVFLVILFFFRRIEERVLLFCKMSHRCFAYAIEH